MKKIYYKLSLKKEDCTLSDKNKIDDINVLFSISKSIKLNNYDFSNLDKQNELKDDFSIDSYIVKNKKGKKMFYIGENNYFNNIDILVEKDRGPSYMAGGYTNALPLVITRFVTNLKDEAIIEASIKEDIDSKYSFNLKDLYLFLSIYEIDAADFPNLQQMFAL